MADFLTVRDLTDEQLRAELADARAERDRQVQRVSRLYAESQRREQLQRSKSGPAFLVKKKAEERLDRIIALLDEGKRAKDVAEIEGVSKSRAAQLVNTALRRKDKLARRAGESAC